jgi:hypothetical protein
VRGVCETAEADSAGPFLSSSTLEPTASYDGGLKYFTRRNIKFVDCVSVLSACFRRYPF